MARCRFRPMFIADIVSFGPIVAAFLITIIVTPRTRPRTRPSTVAGLADIVRAIAGMLERRRPYPRGRTQERVHEVREVIDLFERAAHRLLVFRWSARFAEPGLTNPANDGLSRQSMAIDERRSRAFLRSAEVRPRKMTRCRFGRSSSRSSSRSG
jgi:hypothetical protein